MMRAPMGPAELVARFGSPLYVYDAASVRSAYHAFVAAFPYRPLECHYAIVCNKNRYLVRLLHGLGAGVHANTPGDVFAALAAGVPASRIVYSGTNLDGADFDYLLGCGVALNLDSLDQLAALAGRAAALADGRRGVGLRLLIDAPERPNRIGVAAEELPRALAVARAAGLRIEGLHMYAGTNTRAPRRFLACLDRLLEAARLLPDLTYLDLGGGYGIAYREGQSALDLDHLGGEAAARLEAFSAQVGRRARLLLEPGRTLVAAAGTLYATVVSVKERGGRRFVGVDSTVGNIVVESVYHPHHRIEPVSPRGADLPVPTDVCGNTTHSRDYLGRGCRLPELHPGDLLALRDVGAYGYAMSSHFLNRPRPRRWCWTAGPPI
jgi:diaminopimelate decarboxylase